MLNYKTCTLNERKKAIQLSKSIFKDNMEEQFLCLFGEENIDHMFLCLDDELVVSMVNYYPSVVTHPLFSLRVASIGSVCTLDSYRGQAIASKLLEQAQNKMLEERIRLAIISGDGGLYTRFGSKIVGNVHAYKVTRKNFNIPSDIQVIPFKLHHLNEMFNLYQHEPLRFLRTKTEFELLFKGQTTSDTFATYPTFLSEKNGVITSYVILNQDIDKKTLIVKEFAGERQDILDLLQNLLVSLKKLSVMILIDPTDSMKEYLVSLKPKPTSLHASLKIVDFLGFIQDLNPYMNDKCRVEELTNLSFYQEENRYFIQYKDETLDLSIYELNQLVFGPSDDIIKKINSRNMKNTIQKLFPIPFVWVNNLNYQ